MKIIITAALAVVGFGSFYLGARSTRPDLTLTPAEELSQLRAESALHRSLHALAENKDQAKVKALTDDRDAKQKADLAIADGIRKSHRCETCIFRWYLETDGSLKLETQPQAPVSK